MKSIITNASESRLIRDGKQTIIVTLVKPQPIFSEDGNVYEGRHRRYYKNDIRHPDWTIQFCEDFAPYKIGTPVYLREPWCSVQIFSEQDWPIYRYKADGNDLPVPYQWRSGATMPKDAARTWVDPVRNECKRVRDVTRQDLIARFGFQGHNHSYIADWIHYIINKFGSPAWDSNAWVWLTHVAVNKELTK